MNTGILLIIYLLAGLFSIVSFGMSFEAVNESVIIEAEDMTTSRDVSLLVVHNASNGKGLEVVSENANNNNTIYQNPSFASDIEIIKAGKYSLWVRVKAPDNDSDEIFCYYTGKDRYINAEFDSGSEYVWVKLFLSRLENYVRNTQKLRENYAKKKRETLILLGFTQNTHFLQDIYVQYLKLF